MVAKRIGESKVSRAPIGIIWNYSKIGCPTGDSSRDLIPDLVGHLYNPFQKKLSRSQNLSGIDCVDVVYMLFFLEKRTLFLLFQVTGFRFSHQPKSHHFHQRVPSGSACIHSVIGFKPSESMPNPSNTPNPSKKQGNKNKLVVGHECPSQDFILGSHIIIIINSCQPVIG